MVCRCKRLRFCAFRCPRKLLTSCHFSLSIELMSSAQKYCEKVRESFGMHLGHNSKEVLLSKKRKDAHSVCASFNGGISHESVAAFDSVGRLSVLMPCRCHTNQLPYSVQLEVGGREPCRRTCLSCKGRYGAHAIMYGLGV